MPGGDGAAGCVAKLPASVEWVAVHDAARPLVSQELIDRVLAAAVEHGAAAPAVPSVATLKEAVGPLPAPVERTLPRGTVWATQTPQIARRADLLHAYTRCPIGLGQITDDAQLLEAAGLGVWLVEGGGAELEGDDAARSAGGRGVSSGRLIRPRLRTLDPVESIPPA